METQNELVAMSIRVDIELHNFIKSVCENEKRSINHIVNEILNSHFEKKEYD